MWGYNLKHVLVLIRTFIQVLTSREGRETSTVLQEWVALYFLSQGRNPA